ncbi:Hydroxysqualene dehydroxylase [uncultured Gammaproteobacteria bacterium]
MSTIHIIGAGLAGLACAVRLTAAGKTVAVHEAAPNAGGRCRSFYDQTLDRRIDNGNHLLLSANRSALAYLAEIGASETLITPERAEFPFVDLDSGQRWLVRPNRGPLPWWLLNRSRRVPDTRLGDYASGLKLLTAPKSATVADCVAPDHPLYRRFWEPLTLAVMNVAPDQAAVAPLRLVLLETFARGAEWCRPLIARDGLADSLVEPALAWLRARGVEPGFGRRLRILGFEGGRVASLDFTGQNVMLEAGDAVVLAVPPATAATLVPGLTVPEGETPIVNAHFRLPRPAPLPFGQPFIGVVGGAAHWVFVRGDIASVTVSGATDLVDLAAEEITARLWRDVARALELDPGEAPPPCRIVKEKRATFLQTPANLDRRPPARTAWPNLMLAGDWTATGLPATIESAVRSGQTAATALLRL